MVDYDQYVDVAVFLRGIGEPAQTASAAVACY